MSIWKKKEKVVDNVGNIFIVEDKNALVCLEDYNSDKERGNLVLVDDFEKSILAQDVHNFFYRDLNSILFITDYNESRHKGDLWLYNGKEKNIKIDNDVTGVVAY